MDKGFLLTEQIKWHENAVNIVKLYFPDTSITFGRMSLEQKKSLKDFFKELSNTCFSEDVDFQEYLSGEKLIYSPNIGILHFDEDMTPLSLISLIEGAYIEYYQKLRDWKLLQIFFNHKRSYKIILNNGFPKLIINKRYAAIFAPWNKYDVSPVEKNLRRLRYQLSFFLDDPTEEALEKFKSRNYGILNKSVSNTTCDVIPLAKEA